MEVVTEQFLADGQWDSCYGHRVPKKGETMYRINGVCYCQECGVAYNGKSIFERFNSEKPYVTSKPKFRKKRK